ncbi:MAG: SDR family oxidoreductase [Microthrixaceae bacterium]|nr:SDR family oxidoreductase [Microthrixaceae bacterium]
MNLGISHRRAIVAAGSAGLGLATARALAGEGVAVAICGRNPDRLNAALASLGSGAVAIVADMSVPGDATRFAAEAQDRLGGTIDIVVANAGGPPPGTALSTDPDAYRGALELNFISGVELIQAVVSPMRAQRWGRVIAVTSIGARQPIANLAASSSARAAMTSFIKTLSLEIAADQVTANTIQPGLHATDRVLALHGGDPSGAAASVPVGRLGDAAEFGAAAAFLCSEHAGFITGTSLLLDGGASTALI